MEAHPKYGEVKSICQKYPRHAGSFFQAYCDISIGQNWTEVEVEDIEQAQRAVIKGLRPGEDDLKVVVPCALSESLSISWINNIFEHCSIHPIQIYIAITTDDSSIVYYKISKGIVKPPI